MDIRAKKDDVHIAVFNLQQLHPTSSDPGTRAIAAQPTAMSIT